MMGLRLQIFALFTLLSINICAQIDTEFWFAAPDISSEYGQAPKNGAPISLHFTALYATTVTISRPADPSFAPIQIALADLEHKSIELSAILPLNQIETYPRALTDPTAFQDKGFKITAYPGEISCYYELNNKQNKDIFPLKGTNGLGKEFFVSTQNQFINGDYKGTAWSGFVVVATENNTTINVELNDDILYFVPHPATVTIHLNEGQTYAFRALSTLANRHINGVRVTSDKNIAITVYDDALQKERVVGGTSWDLFGDQIIPIDIIGNEYIIMKGFMVDAPEDGGERIFVTATTDNTSIYIDNSAVPVAVINKGKVFSYPITNQTTLVTSSAPVYINHLTGFEADLGGAVLPPIGNCSGSYDVAFNRSPDPSENFYLNIMVKNVTTPGDPMRNQAVKNFSITANGVVTPIPESYFTYILDSTYAVLKRDPVVVSFVTTLVQPGWPAMVRNPLTKFHLGTINGHINTGCKYGYFSDYKVIGASAGIGGALSNTREVYCDLDPIRLVARGGMRYEWTCTSDPSVTKLLSSTTVSDPFFMPVTSGNYMFNVKISQDCGPTVNLPLQVIVMFRPVANFDVDPQEGCSPLKVTITHHVDMTRVGKMMWHFDFPDLLPAAKQDTLAKPFTWNFPVNNTDSVISYRIRLYTWAPFNACPDQMEKTVLIRPGVKADFSINDSAGCHPFPVLFNNLSTGHLNGQSYYWDFGDQLQSYDSVPDHTYENYGTASTTYTAKLVVTSPLECKDSVSRQIVVHPFINASLLVDSTGRCSPITTRLNPINSIGVDTFRYTIRSPKINQNLNKLTIDPVVISYRDTSYSNGPDTLKVSLVALNRMGCSDTVTAKKIIIYPEIKSQFDIDPPEICDATATTIMNKSFGRNVNYIWDFGDGSSAFDTSIITFNHTYYNLDDDIKVYNIVLEGINQYLCHSVSDTTITVYPRVNAFFTIENTGNCSPIHAIINNFSHRVSHYTWDLGDGSAIVHHADPVFYHDYINPLANKDTTYLVKLNVVSPEGCLDSMERSLTLLPQVVADFAMSDSASCSPATISFDNYSTGSNLVYIWQFGDILKTNNVPWFQETFSNFETNDSAISVVLTVSNPQGCEATMTKKLTVYPFVDAIFGINNFTGCSPLDIGISNFSSPGSSQFNWDFGDGHTSNNYQPGHSYSNLSDLPEKDTIRLVAGNLHGCYDTAYTPVTIFPALHADFSISDLSGCQPLSISLGNNTNIIQNTSFLWDFGNGRYSNAAEPPSQKFNNLNSNSQFYNITLEGISQYGCTDDTTQTVEVYPYIFARFTTNKPGICSDEVFSLDRSLSAGAISHYYWDYEADGIRDEDNNTIKFNHTYSNTGNAEVFKTIELTVTNAEGCDTSWRETIAVHPQVRASFGVDHSEACYPATLSFTNQSEPAIPLSYYWDMGDGSGTTNKDITYYYRNFSHTDNQVFKVSLTATSKFGCDSTFSKSITIHPKPLSDFSFPVAADCPPFTVPFTNRSLGSGLIYHWDLGGSQSAETNPTTTFYNSGTSILENSIALIAENQYGCSDTAKKPLRVYPGVKVDYNASSWEGCNPLEIEFNGTATNENEYYWLVDGEIISNFEDPFYRFVNETTEDKVFNVQFRAVSIHGCKSDTLKQITVFSQPLAEFLPNPQACEFNTVTDLTPVTFNNRTLNQPSWDYSWNFGDGSRSHEAAPNFIKNYAVWGDNGNGNRIPVTMIATNKNHAVCSDTVMRYVIIYPPLPKVDLGPDISGCMPLTVNFPSTAKYNYSDSYQWDFGYENRLSTEQEPSSMVYDSAGTYIVRLSVSGDGGSAYAYKLIHVFPEPKTGFEFDPDYAWLRSQTEEGEPIKFFNTTDEALDYTWDFGDGTSSVEYQPKHEYMQEGTFYVTLTAENGLGCTSSFTGGPIVIDGHGYLRYPDAITIIAGNPANEYYDADDNTNRSIFRPLNRGIEKYKLEIYNRWGELIFESHEVDRGWNGFIEGHAVKQDVYVWRVTATFTNGKPYTDAGDVTVLVKP